MGVKQTRRGQVNYLASQEQFGMWSKYTVCTGPLGLLRGMSSAIAGCIVGSANRNHCWKWGIGGLECELALTP